MQVFQGVILDFLIQSRISEAQHNLSNNVVLILDIHFLTKSVFYLNLHFIFLINNFRTFH